MWTIDEERKKTTTNEQQEQMVFPQFLTYTITTKRNNREINVTSTIGLGAGTWI